MRIGEYVCWRSSCGRHFAFGWVAALTDMHVIITSFDGRYPGGLRTLVVPPTEVARVQPHATPHS